MANILICDDEKDIVNALKIYLSDPDYTLFEAYDGEEALRILPGRSATSRSSCSPPKAKTPTRSWV